MIVFILTPFLSQPSKPLLSSPLKLQNFTTPNECVCVWRFGVSFTYMIESIDSKLISVCLINDYSLIADLHIFVYGSAECATILLECTKVKLLILYNFGFDLKNNDQSWIFFSAPYILYKHIFKRNSYLKIQS